LSVQHIDIDIVLRKTRRNDRAAEDFITRAHISEHDAGEAPPYAAV